MQMDLVPRLDGREEVLVVVDSEIGVMAALHEQTRAAERQRLLALLEDDRLLEPVADLVRSASHCDEVARAEELDGILVGDPLARGGPREDLGDGSSLGDAHAIAAPAVVCTKRSSGTVS